MLFAYVVIIAKLTAGNWELVTRQRVSVSVRAEP
jgi:hypothetical protein